MVNGDITITRHACERYVERIEDVPLPEVVKRIREHAPAIRKAAAFGASKLRIGNLELAIAGLVVLSVIKRERQKYTHQSDDRRCLRRRVRSNGRKYDDLMDD